MEERPRRLGRGSASVGLRSLCGLTLTVVLCLLLASAACARSKSPPDPEAYGPSYRFCGSLPTSGRIDIYANEHLGCRRALRVERAYWEGPSNAVVLHPNPGGEEYLTLKRFPGWRCTFGAGGGGCEKGKKRVAYVSLH